MQIPLHTPLATPSRGCHRIAAFLIGLLLIAGCVGPAQRPILGEPEGHPGFPSETFVGDIWAEARFVENHPKVLGQDLSDSQGIVPVALRIGQRAGGQLLARLDPNSVDPVLYLQDGTALSWVPLEDLETSDEAVSNNALSISLIPDWTDARSGFLFFSARKAGVRLKGRNALVIKQHVNLELDLLGSVIAFTVSTPAGPQRVHLGLGLESWEVSR